MWIYGAYDNCHVEHYLFCSNTYVQAIMEKLNCDDKKKLAIFNVAMCKMVVYSHQFPYVHVWQTLLLIPNVFRMQVEEVPPAKLHAC